MSVSVQGTAPAQSRRIGSVPTASAASEHHRRDKLNYILHDPPPRSSSKGTPVPGPYRYPRVSQRLRLPGSDDEREEEDEAEDEDDDEHTVDDAAAATAAAAADAAAASTRHLSLALSGGADSDDESDIANDVVHDPFFLKYTLQGGTSDHEVEEDDSEDEDDDDDDRDSSSSDADTVGPRSPASPRAFRQDSITDPLYSPGPSSPRTFPPLSPAASFASLASITSAAGAPSPAAKARAAAATSNRATEFSNPFGDATQRHDSSAMQEVNIAVVGARGIGKSTFIQNAFGLSGKPEERSVQRPMVLERIVYHCRLIEVQLDDLDVDDDGQKICWPENVGESFLPRIDGMFLLYNAQNQESMECEDLLRAASLPCVLVANDSSNLDFEAKAKAAVPELAVMRTAHNTPSSQQQCTTVLLRSIVSKQNQAKFAAARRRANTSAVRGTLERVPHARANSEYSIPGPRLSGSTLMSGYASSISQHSFLNMDDVHHRKASLPESELDYAPSVIDENIAPDIPNGELGYTFDQLVDKLLSQPLSKTDSKFVAIFLALYRVFAAPLQLVDAILLRFDNLRGSSQPPLITTRHQQRYLSVLDQWVSTYPGDFANKATRQRLYNFANSLLSISIFSIAAKEISGHLDVEAEDDDADWGLSDDNVKSGRVLSSSSTIGDETEANPSRTSCTALQKEGQSPTSIKSRSPGGSAGNINFTPTHTLIHIIESAATQARSFIPHPRIVLSKTQWRSLLEQSDESIAKELTHMDWIMFSSIRPRDLVRHVSVPTARKMQTKSLENVNRAIEHFNHLAYWVANFIIFRDKPKHRALMMEKFMRVARKLREYNNYNSLGAILAGLQSTPIHRLLQTRDLVNPSIQKDYLKLEILMGTGKSHFAYRLAWENSSIERIPYIPLHLRDLMSASQGNRTFLTELVDPDGPVRINWKKFEIMGEVVVGIQRAQEVPYPKLERNEEAKSLLLECKLVKDDDELYDRSTQLEPAFGAGDRRRFNWFQRSASTQP